MIIIMKMKMIINACPASLARHLAIPGCAQHALFALDSLVVMPACCSLQMMHCTIIHKTKELNNDNNSDSDNDNDN